MGGALYMISDLNLTITDYVATCDFENEELVIKSDEAAGDHINFLE